MHHFAAAASPIFRPHPSTPPVRTGKEGEGRRSGGNLLRKSLFAVVHPPAPQPDCCKSEDSLGSLFSFHTTVGSCQFEGGGTFCASLPAPGGALVIKAPQEFRNCFLELQEALWMRAHCGDLRLPAPLTCPSAPPLRTLAPVPSAEAPSPGRGPAEARGGP